MDARNAVVAAVAVLVMGTVAALAQTAPPAAEDNFALAPAEGRHLKIDRRSGDVSLCAETNGTWSCRLLPEDRKAFEEEVARLEAEKAALLGRLDGLERRVADLEAGRRWIGPDEQEKLDRFMDFTDEAFRRFFGLVETLKRDLDQPDRT